MSEQIPYILQGADSPREVMVCAFVRIVPARFALSSDEAPPVQGRLPAETGDPTAFWKLTQSCVRKQLTNRRISPYNKNNTLA